MPAMIVSPVSSSVATCSVGSSRRAVQSLAQSVGAVAGQSAMAMRITGSGTYMFCSVQ